MLIECPHDPALGVGESAAVPAAAAIANTILDAAGTRLREAPSTPEKARMALGGTFGVEIPPKRHRARRVLAWGQALWGL